MSFSSKLSCSFIPATTRFLFPSLPPSLTPTPSTDPWTDGNGNPVVSWHDFCNLQNKTFFFVLSPPHPRVSAIPTALGSRVGRFWIAALFCSLVSSPHLKATPSTASSQGWAFPVLIQTQHQEIYRKETPFRSAQQLGRCGERGKGGISAVTPARMKRDHPGALNCPRLHASVYSQGLGLGTVI